MGVPVHVWGLERVRIVEKKSVRAIKSVTSFALNAVRIPLVAMVIFGLLVSLAFVGSVCLASGSEFSATWNSTSGMAFTVAILVFLAVRVIWRAMGFYLQSADPNFHD